MRAPWPRWPLLLVGLGGLALAGAVLLLLTTALPRVRQEQQRIEQQGRAMLAGTVPVGTLDRTRVELRPTPHAWLVIFRGADVPCEQTSWRASCTTRYLASQQPVVFRDLYACVDYRHGTAYMAAGTLQPAGTSGCLEPPR